AYGKVVAALVAEKSPRLTMIGSTTMGMDLAAWLAAKTGQEFVAFVSNLAVDDGELVATSQLYAGKMMAEVAPEGERLVAAVLAGA
ncbi:MAG: electron transfer flavoprotein subunit alpha/FixB family protein, partial [Phycisphaerae bacterium]|nr:electron transfer flavoprotein subunit alpha/FixB family protein [Phycisphaerae bacterium]NIR62226.1 electron transfer flavoprotein subunit alpha/FixB family protein [candidate division Zixibacteria bacterium]NIW43223.1 electron transfer flavoprotein subunit alpha/FixB family protein [Gammaproteobacteria bacterium]NIP50539.1 electron transfer flavoprotein subunit alpha/FixB family protein [Phycisphaerae bacterium]NIU12472.1 electron transfer flavoprotein subunit alpha/FixB family protein [ca